MNMIRFQERRMVRAMINDGWDVILWCRFLSRSNFGAYSYVPPANHLPQTCPGDRSSGSTWWEGRKGRWSEVWGCCCWARGELELWFEFCEKKGLPSCRCFNFCWEHARHHTSCLFCGVVWRARGGRCNQCDLFRKRSQHLLYSMVP